MTVERACRYIEENYDSRITLKSLAETLGGISSFHLQRKFKQVLGLSPRQYLESVRLKRLKLSLARGDSAVRSTYSAGYNTSSWLYSGSRLGMNPSAYKNGGERELIRYVTAGCNLGRLLVGGTDRGVCAVSLGDSDDELLSHLREEYPKAEIVRESKDGGDSLSSWVAKILECLVQGRDLARTGLPLDVCGTAFQFRVWHELRNIPRGSTKSYSEVARKVGCPKGSRAVASACARNHVALLIPCHRVVRKGGELGGYRWGVERKKILLEQEKKEVKES